MTGLFDDGFEDEPREAAAPTVRRRRVLGVTELTCEIRERLEAGFTDVWVEGELSNCRLWNTGHYYFTLKDTSAQIKAVLFRSAVRYLRFKPEDGQHVLARGRVSVYEPKGEYQLVCEHLEPMGHGALQLAFEQLKRRLQAEGLFDAARKRPLPTLPRRIGVVTSLDGAAVRDIIKVVSRRHATVRLLLRPTRVQGDGAAGEIAEALRRIVRVDDVDVVVLARGGGSLEDLAPFNSEPVARAIVASPVPVITGIGHETDVTIADFVADVRAATPSNAAEIVIASRAEFVARLDALGRRLRVAPMLAVRRWRTRVDQLCLRPGFTGVRTRVALRGRDVSDLEYRVRHAIAAALVRRRARAQALRLRLDGADQRRRLAAVRRRLLAAESQLRQAVQARRHAADRRFRALAGRLDNLSPLAVLSRGYAVCWTGDRTAILRDASTVDLGAALHVTLARGELECEVTATRPAPAAPPEPEDR